jgi:hypothetical protein
VYLYAVIGIHGLAVESEDATLVFGSGADELLQAAVADVPAGVEGALDELAQELL